MFSSRTKKNCEALSRDDPSNLRLVLWHKAPVP